MMFHYRRQGFALLVLVLATLSACSTTSPRQSAREFPLGERVVDVAERHLGAPYRWGEAGPTAFDCSGLVFFSFSRVGVAVPRTTAEQYRESRPVSLTHLQPGDLVFFRLRRRSISHVGIYVGDMRFIHAPSGGKRVDYADLRDSYWRSRFAGAGRPY